VADLGTGRSAFDAAISGGHENVIEAHNVTDFDLDVPKDLLCPVSYALMIDPVKTATGKTYSRTGIARWFNSHRTDPLTNLQVRAF
jgi:hypothetical protein